MIGHTISHYKITGKLGEGAMGVVYKAEDTRLKRTVALKFLSKKAFGDEQEKARFFREAQAAAGLDHPNICTVYEIDEADGETFISMAYIAGESLKEKVAAGPLKLEEALNIAIGIGQGLQEAHENEIVHRDIKSANIMVTTKGEAKITDFGLAYLAGLSKLTKTGTTLGTPAYMSPEQALGQPPDRRSDVWSLGVVLYEMVTGRVPFEGDYEQVILYEILNEPHEPVTARRAGLPMELDRILGKALAKKPEERYQHADDMTVDLRRLQRQLEAEKSAKAKAQAATMPGKSPRPGAVTPADAGSQRAAPVAPAGTPVGTGTPAGPTPSQDATALRPAPARISPAPSAPADAGEQPVAPAAAARRAGMRATTRERIYLLVAAALLVALLTVSFLYFRQTAPETPLRRFAFTPPDAVGTTLTSTNVAISPNGKHIAFIAGDEERKLWVQDLDQRQPRAIDGTAGAGNPFWSPDSDFIGFAVGGELKKVSVQGGLAIRVCELPGGSSGAGTWSPDGEVIVFSSGGRLYEVPGRGGTPSLLISPEESEGSAGGPTVGIYRPRFLPSEAGARVLVFAFGFLTEQTMMVQNVETGQRELLGPGAMPFYSPSGHLVYQSGPLTHDLWALPFSLDTLKATGEAFPIVQNSRGPTMAADQTLVYLDSDRLGQQQLVWLDRRGEKTGEIGPVQEAIDSPALSPDGRLLAVTATEGSNQDVWVYDIARGVRTRLSTSPGIDRRPVWSPAGDEVAFSSDRAGNEDILLRQADGSGEEKVLLATPRYEMLSDWSSDGKYLLYQLQDPETGFDLWYLERNEDGSGWEPHPFLQTPFNQNVPRFSPDGRYVAYVSTESGQNEVYVQPFPEGGRKSAPHRLASSLIQAPALQQVLRGPHVAGHWEE